MSADKLPGRRLDQAELGLLKKNLADFFSFSRVVIGLFILSLSFSGQDAFLAVVILTLVGGLTDMLDGRIARYYFGEQGGGRLGKLDAEIDTFFLLCVAGYMSLTGVVAQPVIGLSWIVLVVLALALSRRSLKVMIVAEVVTVISLMVVSLLFSPRTFWVVIVPVMAAGLLLNRRRVLYLLFDYWPSLYLKRYS